MRRVAARVLLTLLLLAAAAGCGYQVSSTFNADGSVVVGLEFLLPTALLKASSSQNIQGFSPADLQRANDEVRKQYPGAKVTGVTEGDQTGALVTLPFKNEKDAFAFLTQPSNLLPKDAASSASPPTVDVGNTGGIFATATHTTSAGVDTYRFTTQPPTITSSPGPTTPSEQAAVEDLASIFTFTFALTLPREITSAPGALFTLDRKTAVWTLDLGSSRTLTATTASGPAGLAANLIQGPNVAFAIGFGAVAIVIGFILGFLAPWRRLPLALVPATGPVQAGPIVAPEPAGDVSEPPADTPPPPPGPPS